MATSKDLISGVGARYGQVFVLDSNGLPYQATANTTMEVGKQFQGIKTLAPELKALAHAPDGLVEALTFSDASQFTLGVQWHPEWKTWQNPLSIKIFAAFGAACQTYADARDAR